MRRRRRLLATELTAALGGAADVVGGIATVMVHATDADADLLSVCRAAEAVRDEADRQRADRVSRARNRTSGHGPVPLRRPRSRRGGDARRLPTRRGGGTPHGRTPDCRRPRLLARASPISRGCRIGCDAVPRRARPRPMVPAGSVAIANGHAAVYPTASPGGWQLVGRTAFPLFSPVVAPYAVLAPGDRVQFTGGRRGRAGRARAGGPASAWSPPPGSRPVFEVVAPGLRAVLQDGGRRGVAAAGVPGAGPADPLSFELANRLAGNAPESGALELTGGGTRLRVSRRLPCGCGRAHRPRSRVDGTAARGRAAVAAGGGSGPRHRPPTRRAAAATWRSPAASSGPRGSAAVRPTS